MNKDELQASLITARGEKQYYRTMYNRSIGFFSPHGNLFYDAEYEKWKAKVEALEELLGISN